MNKEPIKKDSDKIPESSKNLPKADDNAYVGVMDYIVIQDKTSGNDIIKGRG